MTPISVKIRRIKILLVLLSKFSSDIIFRSLISGFGKDLINRAFFHQVTVQKKSCPVSHPGGLLNVMGYQNDGIIFFQSKERFLNAGGGDRIQSRTGLIKEEDFWF